MLWISAALKTWILTNKSVSGGSGIKGRRKPQSRTREVRARINGEITCDEVRVIGSDGEQVGVVPIEQAMEMAEEDGLDLVEVSPTAEPPVCRIMDFGKYRYEQSKKQAEAKKK